MSPDQSAPSGLYVQNRVAEEEARSGHKVMRTGSFFRSPENMARSVSIFGSLSNYACAFRPETFIALSATLLRGKRILVGT
jgi:hypothetical protein